MKLPSALSGSVTVPVPKFNVWLGIVGVFLAYAGMLASNWPTLSIGIGALSVMPIGVGVQWLGQWRLACKTRHWPTLVQVEVNEEGERIAFVTLAGGDMLTLPLPDGYDPGDDNGEWFIRQVAPDLAAQIFDEESE